MSHVMRTFWGNGLRLKRGHEWLHVRFGQPLRDVDVRVLAWAVEAPAEWLSERLFVAVGLGDDRRLRLGTQQFSPAAVLPGKSARVCPHCLSEFGFCDLVCSFKLGVVCPRHKVPYLGVCMHCRRTISWDRLQIDICKCGRYLKPPPVLFDPPAPVIGWAQWVSERVATSLGTSVEAEGHPPVPKMLNELSLDGAFRLVEAFGMLTRADEQPRAAAANARSVAGAVEMIARGLERLSLIDGRVHRIRDLAPQIHVAALERLRASAVEAVDSNCAALLLRHLGDRSGCHVDMRGRHPRGQLSLFA